MPSQRSDNPGQVWLSVPRIMLGEYLGILGDLSYSRFCLVNVLAHGDLWFEEMSVSFLLTTCRLQYRSQTPDLVGTEPEVYPLNTHCMFNHSDIHNCPESFDLIFRDLSASGRWETLQEQSRWLSLGWLHGSIWQRNAANSSVGPEFNQQFLFKHFWSSFFISKL